MLRSQPIYYDVRRLDKEGRIGLIIKYGYNGIYRLFFGDPYEAVFNYELQGGVVIQRGKKIEEQEFIKNNSIKKRK